MLAQWNAYLKRIQLVGGDEDTGWSEDYDRPATDPEDEGGEGEDRWIGNVAVYWLEVRRRVNSGNSTDVILERSMICDGRLADREWVEGEIVTVDHEGVEKSGKVVVAENRRVPGIPPSVRLTLEDA